MKTYTKLPKGKWTKVHRGIIRRGDTVQYQPDYFEDCIGLIGNKKSTVNCNIWRKRSR